MPAESATESRDAPAPPVVNEAGRGRAVLALAAIVLIALGARIWALERPGRILSRDGIRYAKIARSLAEGRAGEALANDYAPGAPAAAALAGLALGAGSDRGFACAAALASTLLGALSVVPVYLLAARAAGPRAGLLAALALAVHPHHVDVSADALSEPLLLLGALGSLAAGFEAAERRSLKASALSGLLGGAAYLARPEGIVAAFAPLVLAGDRARRAAATLAALMLLAAPYVAHASAHAGSLAITRKKDAGALVAGALADPALVASNALRNTGRALESGQVTAALSVLGLACALARPGARRRLAIALGAALLAMLIAESLVRADPRFGLVLSVLAIPLAGVGLDDLLGRWSARRAAASPSLDNASVASPELRHEPLPTSGARHALVAALLLALASLPGIVHATTPDHPHYLECARAIEADGASRGIRAPSVLAPDARIAHLAGDERAIDARGRPRLGTADAARADFVVRFEGDPPPEGVLLEPLGRFEPPAGSRGRTLLADRVPGEK